MSYLRKKLAQFKKWILFIVVGRFRYRSEYTSPFGEEWIVYRFWLGIIPITYKRITYMSYYNNEIDEYVNELNAVQQQKLNK